MRMKPMKHQVQMLRWGRLKRSFPMWVEMRLGKTLVAKRWAQRRPRSKHILVVAPLGAIAGWLDTLHRDGVDDSEICCLLGTKQQRLKAFSAGSETARWFLINYEGLTERGHKTRGGKPKAVPSEYALIPWDVVILDESTRIRNARAQITQVALGYLSQAPFKACMSGLPNPEGPQDFVTQMLFLFDEFMGVDNFWSWRQFYMSQFGRAWNVKMSARARIKSTVNELSYILRKRDVGIGSRLMKEKRQVLIPAKVSREITRALRDFEVIGKTAKLTRNVLHALTLASQLTGGRYPHDDSLHHNAKFIELASLAKTELAREKLVVAAQYTPEVKAAAEFLEKAKKTTAVVVGTNARKSNNEAVRRFQRGSLDALVVQPKCLQMGVDLSRASTTIHLSRWWDYEINAQFDERTEHPTRTDPRLCIDLVGMDTPDEDKVLALQEKGADSKTFLRRFISLVRQRVTAS